MTAQRRKRGRSVSEDADDDSHDDANDRDRDSASASPPAASPSSSCERCQDLECELENAQKSLLVARSRIAELQSKLHSEIIGNETSRVRMRGRYEAEVRRLHMEAADLRDQVEEYRDSLDEVELARADLEINNDELFRKLHGKSSDVAALQRTIDELTKAQTPAAASLGSEPARSAIASAALRDCVCCASACINTVFIACGHAATCEACAQKLHSNALDDRRRARCPICRRDLVESPARPATFYMKITIAC